MLDAQGKHRPGYSPPCASAFINYCQARQIPVPGHMAVLGVDNDDMAAFRTPVPISNIVLPTYDIARQTAPATT